MKSPLRDQSYQFALSIISLSQKLEAEKSFVIGRQILKSGTSIGANIEEGVEAQSRADFISKFSIALKEAVETRYWLRLIRDANLATLKQPDYLKNLNQIIHMLIACIKTAKKNSA